MAVVDPKFTETCLRFIGSQVRKSRNGQNQVDVARNSFLSQSKISLIETGRLGYLRIEDLLQLGETLDVDFRLWLPSPHYVKLLLRKEAREARRS